MTVPSFLTISGSPITGAGTLALGLAVENAKLVLAGPTSGPAAAPTFRSLVAADIPSLSYVASVGLTLAVPSSILTESVTGSPITGTGTLAATIGLQVQDANEVWAGPTSGGTGAPTFRSLVTADLPTEIYSYELLSTAAQPTLRQIDSELELSSAVTSVSGSVAAIRGAITTDSGGTIGGSSFLYGVQGKLILDGTLNNLSAFNAGVFAQLDTSGAGFAHTSGYLAPIIADMGATSHLSSDALANLVVLLNTTTSLINAILKTEAKASYLFDLSDLGQGAYIVAAGVAGNQDKCLAILVDGTPYFIPINSAHA